MTTAVRRRRAIALTAALAVASPGAWAAAPGHGTQQADTGKKAEAPAQAATAAPVAAPRAAPKPRAKAQRSGPKEALGPTATATEPAVNGPTTSAAGSTDPGSAETKGSAKSQGSQALAVQEAKDAGRSPKQATRLRTAPTTAPTASASGSPPAATPPLAGPATPVEPVPAVSAPRQAQPGSGVRRSRPETSNQRPATGARAAFPSAPTPLAPAPSTVALTAPDPGADTGSAGREQRAVDPPAAAPRTITRTITKVLEFVPSTVWAAIAALAALGLLLALATGVQTVRRRRLDTVRRALVADVGVLQSALLPSVPANLGGAAVTAAYRPAEGLAAGGDFFDGFALPGDRTGLIVGDVAGHGREVVPLTAAVRYSLRAYLEAGLSPRAVLDVAGTVLAGQLGGRQVTVVVAVHDPVTGHLTYACAGHWPPLILGVPGDAVTACSSPPLGAGLPTGRRQTTVALGPGSAACFFTDGLTDVVVRDGRLGLHGLHDEIEALGPDVTAEALLERVVALSDRQPDDMAALVLAPLTVPAAAESLRIDELEVDAAALTGNRVGRFLHSCGAGEAATVAALEEARLVCARVGGAVIAVRTDDRGVSVEVTQPMTSALRLAPRATGASAVAA